MLRLRDLPAAARLGLTFLLLTILGGLAASAGHLVLHHENRDEVPGLSMDDIEGVYRGIRTTAPLRGALERGHPDGLPTVERDALLAWLDSDSISEDYDNLELGDRAPAEVLDRSCLSCHARDAEDSAAREIPLEFWDDVRGLAFSRDVAPLATEIVVASAHTHALGMGSISLLLALLILCSRWQGKFANLLILVSGVALFCDLGSWLLAPDMGALIPLIAVSGTAWMGSSTLLVLMLLAELWLAPGDR